MIESRYWKQDLLLHAQKLLPKKNPPRWSERSMVIFEKELIMSFFMIRMLIERNKVSSKTRDYRATIFAFEPSGEKITKMNQWAVDEIYDLSNEHTVQKSITFIANQLIHHCTMFAFRNNFFDREGDRNWGGVLVCSDYKRDRAIYRLPIEEIRAIFFLIGKDYPTSYKLEWDAELGDYRAESD